jgi:hypothetical protein
MEWNKRYWEAIYQSNRARERALRAPAMLAACYWTMVTVAYVALPCE